MLSRLIYASLLSLLFTGCATTSRPQRTTYSYDPAMNNVAASSPSNVALKPKRKGLLFGSNETGEFQLYWPVRGRISSHFGPRDGRPHRGIDIVAPRGSGVRAAASGRVIFAGRQRGYGRTVIIQHNGFRTLYAHFSGYKVRRGDRVREGQLIGLVGTSGNAQGAHLHFEYRNHRNHALDPMPRLRYESLISKL